MGTATIVRFVICETVASITPHHIYARVYVVSQTRVRFVRDISRATDAVCVCARARVRACVRACVRGIDVICLSLPPRPHSITPRRAVRQYEDAVIAKRFEELQEDEVRLMLACSHALLPAIMSTCLLACPLLPSAVFHNSACIANALRPLSPLTPPS